MLTLSIHWCFIAAVEKIEVAVWLRAKALSLGQTGGFRGSGASITGADLSITR